MPFPLLPLLVPLAGDHHHVALIGASEDALDRRGAVGLDLGAPVGAGDHGGDDLAGILAARVVGGHEHVVGEPRCGLAHEQPLGPVAVMPQPKTSRTPAFGERPCLAQDVLERGRCVGIVDEHGKRLPLVHRFEAARDARHVRDAARDDLVLDPHEPRERDHSQDVLDVEATPQPSVDPDAGRGEARLPRRPGRARRRASASPATART